MTRSCPPCAAILRRRCEPRRESSRNSPIFWKHSARILELTQLQVRTNEFAASVRRSAALSRCPFASRQHPSDWLRPQAYAGAGSAATANSARATGATPASRNAERKSKRPEDTTSRQREADLRRSWHGQLVRCSLSRPARIERRDL